MPSAWWSPDGDTIAFSGDRGSGLFGLWLADSNGANARPITDRGSFDQPFWHPDGGSIAVSARIDGPYRRIYVVSAKGSNLRPIQQPDDVDNVHPAWSPDGRSIVSHPGRGRADHSICST
jgi:Tol biopolymer transport system component